MLFAEALIQKEICQKEKNKYHKISLICGIQKKNNDTNELICKTEIETQM